MRSLIRCVAIFAATVGLFCSTLATASATTLPPPTGGYAATVSAAACPSAGDCVAVGNYSEDSSYYGQGLIETKSGGGWVATAAPLTGLATYSNPHAALNSVSCPSAGACVAIGTYWDALGHQQGLIETESGNKWSATEAPLTGLAASGAPNVSLGSLSCATTTSCVAIGYYTDSSGVQQGLIETKSGSSWRATEAPLPGPAASFAAVTLTSLSCPTASSCVAVGTYWDDTGHQQGLIETKSGSSWSAINAPLIGLASSPGIDVTLSSVSCAIPASCVTVGTYPDPLYYQEGLIETTSGNGWSAAEAPPAPLSTYVQPNVLLTSVSCVTAASCVAIGTYADTSLHQQALLETRSDSGWIATGVMLPSDAATVAYPYIDSIACANVGDCVVGGYYQGATTKALTLRLRGSSWTEAGTVLNDARTDAPAEFFGDYSLAACSRDGYCAIVDTYQAPYGNASFADTAPGLVSTPVFSRSGATVHVSWKAPADDGGFTITGYTATASDLTHPARSKTVNLAATATSAKITGLTPGDSYRLSVAATNLLGTGIPASTTFPTSAQLFESLKPLMVPTGRASSLRSLANSHRYTFTYRALTAGRVTVQWYQITGDGKHQRRTLIATGTAKTTVGKQAVALTLTKAGQRLIATQARTHHHLKLRATASFKPTFSGAVSRNAGFTLR